MIFLLLNAALCGILIWFSFSIDDHGSINIIGTKLVNIALFLATTLGFMTITIALCFWAPERLALIFGKLTLVFFAWYCVSTCGFVLLFPHYKKNKAFPVAQVLLDAFAVYIVFMAPNAIKDFRIAFGSIFEVNSGPMFSGSIHQYISITWYEFLILFYAVFLPLVSALVIWVRMENAQSRLDQQRMTAVAMAVCTSWLLLFFLHYTLPYQSMFRTMTVTAFVPELLMFNAAFSQREIYDGRAIRHGLGRFLFQFAVPSVFAGLLFMALWPLYATIPVVFITAYPVAIVAFFVLWSMSGNFFSHLSFMRDKRYARNFENEITSIDFDKEPSEVSAAVFGILNKYVDTSAITILIDTGTGFLETVYTTREGSTPVTLSMNTDFFDVLLAIRHPVVFRQWAEHDHNVVNTRASLLGALDKNDADAMILLNEGRHVLGLIFLGKKNNSNMYNEYDYSVFTKLYSNFFVLGYYLKNIMNESVVGTVNREIRMSGQIITSIQENMDRVTNPKVDVGYQMIPAHNIGGEFIDLIRLTDTRHIFIIGALSGRGIAASMNMVILKSIIRTFLAETKDFKLLVEKVNTFIRYSLPKGTYFAGTFALMDFATNTMYYINCGSSALFLYTRQYNNVIEIQGEGKVLGFASDISKLIKVSKVNLAPGDVVFSCTDGLIETVSLRGDQFGKDRIQRSLMENLTYPAEKMGQFTYDALVKFTSKELEYDVTILVIKYLGGK